MANDLQPNESFPPFGLYRILAVSPQVAVGDPAKNVEYLWQAIEGQEQVDLVLYPELAITGYSCGDLFAQDALLDAAVEALFELAEKTAHLDSLIVVGLPIQVQTSLMNVAAVIQKGKLLGMVPKQFLPTYGEFYEGRWFRAADGSEPETLTVNKTSIPFGRDLLFRHGDAVLGIEICEDLWTPLPPSSFQAVAGANVLLNLSASNEIIGKAKWRRDLVTSQSGRCVAAYAYASAGPTESTTDLVFGGACLIAENGQVLGESRRVGDGGPIWKGAAHVIADVDLQRIQHDRRVLSSFDDGRSRLTHPYRMIEATGNRKQSCDDLPLREIVSQPFVPANLADREERCAEIFGIQTAGLAKRVSRLPESLPLIIGVSGGLDSTLALLVAVQACDQYGWSRKRIHGLTMPGFGTTVQTEENAVRLMDELGIATERIDIRSLCLQSFRALQHKPLGIEIDDSTTIDSLQSELQKTPADANDLVFENVQARIRTFLLMSRGFVLGTGDLSEQALGWSTYNGDHMSMYNVNTSIPKTLVRYLVRFAADHMVDDTASDLLHDIADTPISPELLPPGEDGQIRQQTEDKIGPYELHDFFLYNVIRNGFSPEKIRYLAAHAEFSEPYSETQIEEALQTFYRRFFASQFKRSCVPDGPKVGSVSLSPRGDWRMPSDADQGPHR